MDFVTEAFAIKSIVLIENNVTSFGLVLLENIITHKLRQTSNFISIGYNRNRVVLKMTKIEK